MKILKRLGALALAVILVMGLGISAFAQDSSSVADATIDTSATGSITIYKYDLTLASQSEDAGGINWDSSKYTATGTYDSQLVSVLGGGSTYEHEDGTSTNGYAVQGVEFTYLKVADITSYSQLEDGVNVTRILYGFNYNDALLPMLFGSDYASDAFKYDTANGIYYYESDTINDAMELALSTTSNGVYGSDTSFKTALENYIQSNGGVTMAETDSNGKTSVSGLPLGLYLVVETAVPESITVTTDPFFVSLPMTLVDGGYAGDSTTAGWTAETEGGSAWIYDVYVYPKQHSGAPTLEKTVREASVDTGKNNGSTGAGSYSDGYDDNATASIGDVVEYQIVSRLPVITSEATYISEYTYVDAIDYGLTYNVSTGYGSSTGVLIEFYADAACTELVDSWDASNSFKQSLVEVSVETISSDSVTATNDADNGAAVNTNSTTGTVKTMTISLTDAGLAVINGTHSQSVNYWSEASGQVGYSQLYMRITYSCTITGTSEVVLGDSGNDNTVVLLWQRSNSEYYDVLYDDAHVYTYGIDLAKVFSSDDYDYSEVEFIVHNDTDDYYVVAIYNETEGVYYVQDDGTADHSATEEAATHFVPCTDEANENYGHVIIKGLEDDTYTVTEVRTSNGYTLLKDDIEVVISVAETDGYCDVYENVQTLLGIYQNDPRYLGNNLTYMQHHLLTASATVDGNPVTLLSNGGSVNAIVPFTVVNTHTFTLPRTGGLGNWLYPAIGIPAAVLCGLFIFLMRKPRKNGSKG